MNPPNEQNPQAPIIKELFQNAMNSNWEEVINIYKSNPEIHEAKITRSGDTALHIAISDGQESTVEELVQLMVEKENIKALRMKNEGGNTPLHLAAYLGNPNMCRCIAYRDPTLVGIFNEDKETPLSLAVLHGRKHAFLCLNSLSKNRYGNSRGKDGDTILHSAIHGEYFEIALHIIRDYEKLIHWVNEKGFSPLHILASKSLIFRSGSHITRFQQLIYNCIIVDEINIDVSDPLAEDLEYDHNNPKYPENYQTCVGIFLFTRNLLRILMGRSGKQHDEESQKFQPQLAQHEQEQGSSDKMKNQEEGQQHDQEEGQRPACHKNEQERHKPGDKNEQAAGPTKLVPDNCITCFNFVKFLSKAMFVILGLGSSQVESIREKKKKHVWSVQIMRKLIEHASLYEYENFGKRPDPHPFDDIWGYAYYMMDEEDIVENEKEKGETPLLIAAKNGINELVEKILDQFPVAINDMNTDKKNIVLLAVENRQPHIYKFLQGHRIMAEMIFSKTDKYGNNALHIAAMMDDHRPWYTTNAALRLQWEIKWYQYVTRSMPPNYVVRQNIEGQTPSDTFNKHHRDLVIKASEWLKEVSQSCSVVGTLIATVAFATSTTVPGGIREAIGTPTLQHEAAFSIFAISSLVALCFSVTSIIMFLAIICSSFNVKEFDGVLQKLMVGFGSLFVSLSAMLVSFCAAQFLIMKDQLKYAAVPLYVVIFIVMTCYVIIQFPWYFDVALITLKHVPPRIRNTFQ